MSDILISAHELLARLRSAAPPKVLDASMPNSAIVPYVADDDRKIPGAMAFDIERVFSDPASPLPHTLPTIEALSAACQQLGLALDDEIVVYDNRGVFSSPRAYWLLTQAGFGHVRLLDGGLPHWLTQGLPVQHGASAPVALVEAPALKANASVMSVEAVNDNIAAGRFKLVDARSAERFAGTAPEPRPELPSGHVEGAYNLPFTALLDDGHFKSPEQIAALMHERALYPSDRLVFSCGSGITACILWVAAELAGYQHLGLFDGSWTAWATSDHYVAGGAPSA